MLRVFLRFFWLDWIVLKKRVRVGPEGNAGHLLIMRRWQAKILLDHGFREVNSFATYRSARKCFDEEQEELHKLGKRLREKIPSVY